jgi:hypothetical protein
MLYVGYIFYIIITKRSVEIRLTPTIIDTFYLAVSYVLYVFAIYLNRFFYQQWL